ncbi:hypothetical protein BC833DRAFT_570646 [Globomyces pollinis-pini]|nr:hypothetical protein BC833DRAFT_570646 [Globomyces pollinis-pini]
MKNSFNIWAFLRLPTLELSFNIQIDININPTPKRLRATFNRNPVEPTPPPVTCEKLAKGYLDDSSGLLLFKKNDHNSIKTTCIGLKHASMASLNIDAVDKDQSIIKKELKLLKQWDSTIQWEIIFNEKYDTPEEPLTNSNRQQVAAPTEFKLGEIFGNYIKSVFRDSLHQAHQMVFLRSVDGCEAQQLHVIILVNRLEVLAYPLKRIHVDVVQVDIPKWSMLFFHQSLPHGGAAYSEMNVRMHCYLSNATQLIPDNQIQPYEAASTDLFCKLVCLNGMMCLLTQMNDVYTALKMRGI